MAPHSSALAWKIPWTEESAGLQSLRSRRVDMTEQLHFHFSLSCIGEGNGNPLQCSCLEDPRGGGSLVGCRLGGRTESDTTEAAITWVWMAGVSPTPRATPCSEQHREEALIPARSARLTGGACLSDLR